MLIARSLEGVFGALFVLLFFACFMFGLYITREIIRNGFQRTRLQAAISIFVMSAGAAIVNARVWWWCHLTNGGADAAWLIDSPFLLLGAFIEILGVICVIRVFAPDHWGRNVWIGSSVLAAAIAALFIYF